MKYFIIIALLFIFIFGLNPIRGFFRGFFGFLDPKEEEKKERGKFKQKPGTKKRKFFKKDEGEYVDYEELDKK